MKIIFYLAVVILIWLALNGGGLRWCYQGGFWFIPTGCHELKLEVIAE